MSSYRRLALLVLAAQSLGAAAHAESGAFVLGAGLEADSQDGMSSTLIGDLSLAENTWLSASLGYSAVELPRRDEINTVYADLSIDQFFDPAGLRLGVAYWGDSDILDSMDVRASFYSRGEKATLSIDGEYRDFDFVLQPIGTFPGADVPFSAKGLGIGGNFKVTDRVQLRASGMSYEYDVDLRIEESDRIVDLLSVSRLSLLSSLIDWRATAGIGMDFGLKRWQFDVSKWRGAIDGGDNIGATISFLTPMSTRTDLEISLGYDDSDLYGDVTVLSFFVYFYGGN